MVDYSGTIEVYDVNIGGKYCKLSTWRHTCNRGQSHPGLNLTAGERSFGYFIVITSLLSNGK